MLFIGVASLAKDEMIIGTLMPMLPTTRAQGASERRANYSNLVPGLSSEAASERGSMLIGR